MDWFDGYLARRYGQVTMLVSFLVPFADKVIICGTFILLAAVPRLTGMDWSLRAWMVVVIVGRELLVNGAAEFSRGRAVSARMSGKWKMLLQCVAAATCRFWLAYDPVKQTPPDWSRWLLIASVWLAPALTSTARRVRPRRDAAAGVGTKLRPPRPAPCRVGVHALARGVRRHLLQKAR